MKRPALADLPDWPAVMRAPQAAAYLQVSEETFRKHVRPKVREVKIAGAVGWARVELDRYILAEMECPVIAPPMDPVEGARSEWEKALGTTG